MTTKLGIVMISGLLAMTCGASAQDVQQEAQDVSALDGLMAVVGQQLELATRKVKDFAAKASDDMVEQALGMGVEQLAAKVGATPEQLAKLKPILRKEIEGTGEQLDQALTVGMAAAQASLERGMDRQWKEVRAELAEVLTEEQLEQADTLNADLVARLTGLFEPEADKKTK